MAEVVVDSSIGVVKNNYVFLEKTMAILTVKLRVAMFFLKNVIV